MKALLSIFIVITMFFGAITESYAFGKSKTKTAPTPTVVQTSDASTTVTKTKKDKKTKVKKEKVKKEKVKKEKTKKEKVQKPQTEENITSENTDNTITTKDYEIRASHILVKKRKDAVSIRKDILNGDITFEEAAKRYSLCPTGPYGGDLGYFNRRKMDQLFTDIAFDLKIGEISDPVGTKFGWHLIKVVDKR